MAADAIDAHLTPHNLFIQLAYAPTAIKAYGPYLSLVFNVVVAITYAQKIGCTMTPRSE